jgi:RNA polymerase sigma factor (TIGR02999 family)
MVYPGEGKPRAESMDPGPITVLLRRWRTGDTLAADELTALVYPELQRLARARLAVKRDEALSPTELVHEAFLRLAQQRQPEWANRSHFFYICARLMRQILVDLTRERLTIKRGEGRRDLDLDLVEDVLPREGLSILALNDALLALAEFAPRKAQTIEMRYFGGMTAEEIAAVNGVTAATVVRDLRAAKAWLRVHMAAPGHPQ